MTWMAISCASGWSRTSRCRNLLSKACAAPTCRARTAPCEAPPISRSCGPNGPPCAKSSKKRWLAELELVAEANAVQQVVAWRAVRRRSRASRRDPVGRRRDVVRAEQRRVSVQPPVETGTRFCPETEGRITRDCAEAGKILRCSTNSAGPSTRYGSIGISPVGHLSFRSNDTARPRGSPSSLSAAAEPATLSGGARGSQ